MKEILITRSILAFIILFVMSTVNADSVNYPEPIKFTAGDTLTASSLNNKFNETKRAVDDNDTRINTILSNGTGGGSGDITSVTAGNGLTNTDTTVGQSGDVRLELDTSVVQTIVTDTIGVNEFTNPTNHNRYSDTDSKTAMGPLGDTNSLNHRRYQNSDAIAAIKAADGTGSNLDADTLDGFNSSDFVEGGKNCGVGSVVTGSDLAGNITCRKTTSLKYLQRGDNLSLKTVIISGISQISSLAFTAPTNGVVWVSTSGAGQVSHPSIKAIDSSVTYSALLFYISDNPVMETTSPGHRAGFIVPVNSPSGAYAQMFSMDRVFPVTSGQSKTFYLRADSPNSAQSGNHLSVNSTMRLLFIPQ